jgi:hypothetical protein
MHLNELKASERKELGRLIDDERDRRGLTIKTLANKAGCSEKSVRNVIKGLHTRGKTISEICTVLDISLEDAKPILVSNEEHGGYTKDGYEDYIGNYYSYRRSFSFPRNIVRSHFSIQWNEHNKCLCFDEDQRYNSVELEPTIDNSQSGEIFISNTIGLLHLVTKTKGAIRLITISKFRLNDSDDFTMRGIVLTQAKKPLYYQPSTAAIIFEKIKENELTSDSKKGVFVLHPKEFGYDKYNKALTEIERHLVNFALTPPPLDSLKPDA